MTYTPVPYLRRVIQGGKPGWFVVCRRCGPSPLPFRNEDAAVRGRWWHENKHTWPQWMDR